MTALRNPEDVSQFLNDVKEIRMKWSAPDGPYDVPSGPWFRGADPVLLAVETQAISRL